jgi:AraC-like DNA-binding protein
LISTAEYFSGNTTKKFKAAMKPQLLKITTASPGSFSVRQDMQPNVNNRWHYHEELELIQIHSGTGMQFVGDSMQQFNAGDVVLVGSNLPHYWRYDLGAFKTPKKPLPYSTVIHFNKSILGDRFLNLPEARAVKLVLDQAQQGILVSGKDAAMLGRYIRKVHQEDGLRKLLALLEAIAAFQQCKNQKLLSTIGFKYVYTDTENNRIHAIYDYTLSNFMNKIELKKIASVADLVPNSFCRYFKSRTGKTYSKFLLEVRVGNACKLLIENKHTIKEICFASGFKNASCFHEKFKLVTGRTPLQYQREILL